MRPRDEISARGDFPRLTAHFRAMPRIGVALSKLVARSGTSKREADRLVAASRVSVNGNPCRAGGTRVLPDDVVEVDGRRIDTTPALAEPRLWR